MSALTIIFWTFIILMILSFVQDQIKRLWAATSEFVSDSYGHHWKSIKEWAVIVWAVIFLVLASPYILVRYLLKKLTDSKVIDE